MLADIKSHEYHLILLQFSKSIRHRCSSNTYINEYDQARCLVIFVLFRMKVLNQILR